MDVKVLDHDITTPYAYCFACGEKIASGENPGKLVQAGGLLYYYCWRCFRQLEARRNNEPVSPKKLPHRRHPVSS